MGHLGSYREAYRGLLVVAAAAAVVSLRATPASACSCAPAGPFFITDPFREDTFVFLPREGRGVLWWQSRAAKPTKERFVVHRLSSVCETRVPFDLEQVRPKLWLVAPRPGLRPGDVFRVRYYRPPSRYRSEREECPPPSSSEIQRHRVAIKNPPEVTAFVENTSFESVVRQMRLVRSAIRQGEVRVEAQGPCSRRIEAATTSVTIEQQVLERWLPALLFDTLVDGKQDWAPMEMVCGDYPPGSSWTTRGQDMIYSACDQNEAHPGVRPGAHKIGMVVSVPGTKLIERTNVLSVSLRCR
jgi:hypothetical protein